MIKISVQKSDSVPCPYQIQITLYFTLIPKILLLWLFYQTVSWAVSQVKLEMLLAVTGKASTTFE